MGCYLRKTPFAGILNSTMRNNSGPMGEEPGKVINYEFFVIFCAGCVMEDQTVKNPDKGGVQSVARIFELIEVLAAHPAGASLQRLAEDAHLAKSTTHRLLGSLVSLGYAAQDGETGKYRLTLKMFEISSGIVNSMDVMSVAKVHLERLAQRTGEAVHLVIRDAQDIVYIYKTESGPMRMSSRVGLRSPLYCTGVGKAILATLTEEEVEDVWRHSTPQKLTGHTVTQPLIHIP